MAKPCPGGPQGVLAFAQQFIDQLKQLITQLTHLVLEFVSTLKSAINSKASTRCGSPGPGLATPALAGLVVHAHSRLGTLSESVILMKVSHLYDIGLLYLQKSMPKCLPQGNITGNNLPHVTMNLSITIYKHLISS